eukprot:jgi/Mesvir1/27639/Mv07369-RA.1
MGAEDDIAMVASGDVTGYEKINRIGEGTYGVVYRAREKSTGEIVALKKVRMDHERDGMPVTSLRELHVLQACKHKNIVNLHKVVTGTKADSIFLVFEYCPHDLARLMDAMRLPFSESEVKCLLQQLLEAIVFLHKKWIMHRDLKLSNLLYCNDGMLKLCDFGLARHYQPDPRPYTAKVVTLWYRAPELLLGETRYTPAVDMWAVGCIAGELLRHEPLFPGKTEAGMVEMHAQLLGAPNERIWRGLGALPLASQMKMPYQPFNYLKQKFPSLSDSGLDLLNKLLTYDPKKRISAEDALRHPYFYDKPLPKPVHAMPTFPTLHNASSLRVGGRGEPDRAVNPPAGRQRGRDDIFGDVFGDVSTAKVPRLR